MERIIEDVLTIVDIDWKMMAAVLVLELDAVRGVVGIGDFTVYVSDGDGCQSTTYLNDVDIARKEELGEVLGFLEGKHRGLHVILVGGLVIIEGSDTERGGSGTVEVELALCDASEVYVFIAVELIAHEQREVRRAVSDIERLSKKATMNGELEQSALAADAGFYSNRTYNVTYQGEDTLLIQHVSLDDGASIIEHGDVVVRVKRSFKDSVRTTCDSDIYRSSIRRYFNLQWDVASEDVERRIIIDFQHDLFVFKDNRLCLYKKRPNRSPALHGSKDKGLFSLLTLTPERLQKLKVQIAKRRRC